MMQHPGLAAMIPVDEKWAKEKNPPWEHPADKLLEKLELKTKGRLLRMDKISTMPGVLVKPDTMAESDWQAFMSHVDWDKSENHLWIQYTVEG
jgi:hypothetical protein